MDNFVSSWLDLIFLRKKIPHGRFWGICFAANLGEAREAFILARLWWAETSGGRSPRWAMTANTILNFTWFDSAPYLQSLRWYDYWDLTAKTLCLFRLFTHKHTHIRTHKLSESSIFTKANGHILYAGTKSWTAVWCTLIRWFCTELEGNY